MSPARSLLAHPLLILLALVGPNAGSAHGADAAPPRKVLETPMEVRFTDESVLKMQLRADQLTVQTDRGKVKVPFSAILRVELAPRIADETVKKIDAAIRNLGSTEFRKREEASAQLLKWCEKAYPALVRATNNPDAEVVRRARALIAQIRTQVPSDRLVARKDDLVKTKTAKITGRIEETVLKANTLQFGEVALRLEHVFRMRSPSEGPDPLALVIQPAPISLIHLQNNLGKTYAFRLTGTIAGSVWGSDVYTTDSTLGMAAVHAGVLKNGETGVVLVTIVAGQPAYTGSTRNGVTTSAWPAYPSSFRVKAVGDTPVREPGANDNSVGLPGIDRRLRP